MQLLKNWCHVVMLNNAGVGLGMGVLDFGNDRRRGRGSLGGNYTSDIILDQL